MNGLDNFKKYKKVKETEDKTLIKEAWFYPRVSSKNQFDTNDSIENQNKVSQAYAQQNNIRITKIFGGTYESASGDFTRKEFMRLINEIKRSRKRPKYVLIYIMSRFSRTGGNAISLANMLVEDLGVHLIETSSGMNTETDRGKMAVYQKLIEARKETLSRLDSTIPGMKNALLNGKWLGSVPRGYTKYGPRVADEARFAPVSRVELNEEGKLLKQAWKWKIRGERDIDIVRKLRELGLRIDQKKISALWRKPFYAGIIVHNLIDDIVKGDWEPMVSKKNFLKINERIEENNTRQVGYNKEKESDPRPLNGDLRCSKCNANLAGYKRVNKRITTGESYEMHYYRCFNCNAVHVNANTTPKAKNTGLHEQFMEILKSVKLEESFTNAIQIKLIKIIKNRSVELHDDLTSNKKRITVLNKELEELEERFAFGKIPERLYEKFSQKLETEIFDLEKKVSDVDYTTANLSKKISVALKKLQNLDTVWDTGEHETKKRIQKLLFPEGIVVDAEKKLLRTDNINYLFRVIASISASLEHKKKQTFNGNIEKSALVAGTRFELMTFGL